MDGASLPPFRRRSCFDPIADGYIGWFWHVSLAGYWTPSSSLTSFYGSTAIDHRSIEASAWVGADGTSDAFTVLPWWCRAGRWGRGETLGCIGGHRPFIGREHSSGVDGGNP